MFWVFCIHLNMNKYKHQKLLCTRLRSLLHTVYCDFYTFTIKKGHCNKFTL